jgi:hypothetical protein
LHFYDFDFQREVPIEGASSSWNTWTRNVDRSNEDNPSLKRQRKKRGAPTKRRVLVRIREKGTHPHKGMGGGRVTLTMSLRRMQRELAKDKSSLKCVILANKIRARPLKTLKWKRKTTK